MKFKYFLILSALVVGIFFGSTTQIIAQDEMVVQWDDGAGNIVQDALYNAIAEDTLADGSRANLNRVYVLKAGGYYWNYKTIETKTRTGVSFPLRLVGETPGSTFETHPAVVQSVKDIVSGGDPGKTISCSDDLTLKNLYIIGHTELGAQSEYQQIEINAVGKRFVIDNCVLDRSDFSILAWGGGKDNDIFITNCHFRNLIENPSTQQWTGRGISVWTDADTVIIENNTFFNVNMCAIQIENGAANYLRFNHNTLVNIGRSMTSTSNVWWREAYFANLLMVNVFWQGEGARDYRLDYAPGRDPRAYTTGMWVINAMPSRYGTDIGRRILFSHAAAYLDDYFKTRYADTIRIQPFINAITDSFLTRYNPSIDPSTGLPYGQMVIEDTSWLSAYPTFTVNPDDATLLDAMYNNITTTRAKMSYGGAANGIPYYYHLETDPITGDTLWAEPSWPLPENFAYTETLPGTDGLPLGDLNWFPTQKADFENNKDTYITELESRAGGEIVEDVVWSDQAEAGTTGGTAAVDAFTGTAWYTIVGGSNIQWTFNSTYAGPYDIKFMARADGQNIGFDFLVNGEHVVDLARGWGQFVVWTGSGDPTTFWTGKSTSQFYEASYANAELKNNDNGPNLSVVSGPNTLMLKNSWNNISFQWVEFYEAGTTNLIARLVPVAAVNNGATPGGEGTWVPLGLFSVALGSGGTVVFNVDLATAGTYKARIFYQNPDAAQSGSVLLDGTEATTFSFDSKIDSTGADVITPLFNVTAGAHTLTISGTNVKVDWLQLIRQYITSIEDLGILPNGYSLLQNYPNPFNPKTKINFSIAKASDVKLAIFDILGQKVATIINQYMNAGSYSVDFNASHLASGVYIYRLEAGDFKVNKKMMLLK